MGNITYVQRIAGNYLQNMAELPENFAVSAEYLQGLDTEAFLSGFKAYHQVIAQVYSDIQTNPGSFGMPMHESDFHFQNRGMRA